MQILFRDLDEAFICAKELRQEVKLNGRSVPMPLDEFQGYGLRPLAASNTQETLEELHKKLMDLAAYERYPEALVIIQKMLDHVTQQLGISRDATKLNKSHVGHAVMKSMSLFRFHLLLIKTEAYLQSQVGNLEVAKTSLEKVLEFDSSNRLGARELLDALPKPISGIHLFRERLGSS